jgi:hypothetical protein
MSCKHESHGARITCRLSSGTDLRGCRMLEAVLFSPEFQSSVNFQQSKEFWLEEIGRSDGPTVARPSASSLLSCTCAARVAALRYWHRWHHWHHWHHLRYLKAGRASAWGSVSGLAGCLLPIRSSPLSIGPEHSAVLVALRY